MFYLILILVICYLLYKEYKYGKEVTGLIHAYLNLLKISYLRNKKQTVSNLRVYEEVISKEMVIDEYDQVFKTLAKAWGVSYFKSTAGSFADGKRILEELIKKIDYVTKEPGYEKIIKEAEFSLKNPDEDMDL